MKTRKLTPDAIAMMGVTPDKEIARIAGVTANHVRKIRRVHGIKPATKQ